MNGYTKFVQKVLVIAALSLPWCAVEALEKFTDAGAIKKLGYSSFSIKEQRYRVSPTVKIEIPGKRNARLSSLKIGDNIFVKGKVLSGIYYVDLIIYHRIDDE